MLRSLSSSLLLAAGIAFELFFISLLYRTNDYAWEKTRLTRCAPDSLKNDAHFMEVLLKRSRLFVHDTSLRNGHFNSTAKLLCADGEVREIPPWEKMHATKKPQMCFYLPMLITSRSSIFLPVQHLKSSFEADANGDNFRCSPLLSITYAYIMHAYTCAHTQSFKIHMYVCMICIYICVYLHETATEEINRR